LVLRLADAVRARRRSRRGPLRTVKSVLLAFFQESSTVTAGGAGFCAAQGGGEIAA